MTRDEAKQLLPVIQAYAEGKEIQYKKKFAEEEWRDALYLNETQEYTYRIKPQPKFRPFKNMEECWQEMQKHQPFGWIMRENSYINLGYINKRGVEEDSFENFLEDSKFADGQPFGILEE